MDGSNARADERVLTPLRHLPKSVQGAAAAVGAVSAGLILLGACGLGHQDTYVPPPPINADLQAAPVSSTKAGTTTPAVVIPPSPSWRVAADQPSRRAPISTITATPDDPAADPSTTPRTTLSRPTSTRPTTTESPRPTTEPPATTTPPETPPPSTTDHPASDNSDG
ncbi:hypothetical protein VMT65_04180 [Nocardia sp. CDC153]|uniref:hypothetical protein n=1 Tax=Nocardia sp. CDC153 TaxID=3112167 RepID=UPI002DBA379F|nr:hypothetical protein [Nocardia sp. CDC153]MEC3952226.1 hypothetical protein [Nocardia sp. CDC153]